MIARCFALPARASRAALLVAAVACLPNSTARAEEMVIAEPVWVARFDGVEIGELEATVPRLMRGVAARVDLAGPRIDFIATPANGEAEGETTSEKTSSFLKSAELQLAINANPFSLVDDAEGKPEDVLGLLVAEGEIVSPVQEGYPSIYFPCCAGPEIADAPPTLDGITTAISGFEIILAGGEVVAKDERLHPRTAAGLSADGKQLFLIVLDGRQPGWSLGATTLEIAEWLRAMGASEGINLDGGGTTSLVIEGESGEPEILNRPIHAGKPGNERPSGANFGLRARPLK